MHGDDGGDPIAELVSLLARLPSVGERTATRLAFHVLGGDPSYAQALGASLGSIHERVVRCERCGNYGAERVCPICLDPTTTTLECGHAMCEPCMGNLAVSQGQTVTRSRRRVVIQCPLRCLAPTEWVLA